ncbi:MAG: class I SAM-dependent methyltransferase [Candidatus Sumerlaeia bacterium]|nr:class I SAM-dependent methyltransferase [Candidatus Sumerlaeia bacterium]
MAASDRQQVQERRYTFPYHYIPTCEEGDFSLTRTWRWGYEYLSYLRFVIGKIESQPFRSLLDVGCGDGRLLVELRARFPDRTLVGIDRSEAAIHFAQAFCPDVEWVCADFCGPLAMPQQFDVVTAVETLEHIPPESLAAFVEGLHRSLLPDGRLIVTVPTPNVPVPRKHYQHFTADSLQRALKPYFVMQDIAYLNRNARAVRGIEWLICNRMFALQSRRLLNTLFRLYEKRYLPASPSDAKRICVVLTHGRMEQPQ